MAADVELCAALDEGRREAREKKEKLAPEQTNAMVYPAVINESMARQFWPKQDPVGQAYSRGSDTGPWQQVIGVVNDVREWSLTHAAVPDGDTGFDGRSGLFLGRHTLFGPASVPA